MKTPALTAPGGRGSPYLDESPRLEIEPRLAGAGKTDFSHRLVSLGLCGQGNNPPLTHGADRFSKSRDISLPSPSTLENGMRHAICNEVFRGWSFADAAK